MTKRGIKEEYNKNKMNRNGISPCYVGALPQQLAAINRNSINVHLLTLEAAFTQKKDYIYGSNVRSSYGCRTYYR